jgi:hypothetical protein
VGGVKGGGVMEDQATVEPAEQSLPVVSKPVSRALEQAPQNADLVSPFSNTSAFAAAQRMAQALAASSLVPKVYQGNVANCLISMELASRIGVSVLAAMQNLDVIQGKPSWSAKFLIATVNASGRFTPLRFERSGEPGKDNWAYRCVATDRESKERCEGPWVTWQMAKKEGWTTKNGSKWQTMPELMFSYRAAAFWTRLYCPEISIGFQTSEELRDQYGQEAAAESHQLPAQLTPAGAKSLEAVLGMQSEATQVVESPSDELAAAVGSDGPGKREQAGATINGRFSRQLAGKQLASLDADTRDWYVKAVRAAIADLKTNEPKGWQDQLKAIEPHLVVVEAEHEALRAEEAMGA